MGVEDGSIDINLAIQSLAKFAKYTNSCANKVPYVIVDRKPFQFIKKEPLEIERDLPAVEIESGNERKLKNQKVEQNIPEDKFNEQNAEYQCDVLPKDNVSIEVVDLTDDSAIDWTASQLYQPPPPKPKYVFASSLVKLADLQSATSDQNTSAALTTSIIGDSSAAGELCTTTAATTTIATAAVTAETDADRPPPPQANNWRIKITKLPLENNKTLYTCTVCPDDDQRPTFDCIKECKVHLREIHADSGYTCFCVLCGILLDTDELLLAHMEHNGNASHMDTIDDMNQLILPENDSKFSPPETVLSSLVNFVPPQVVSKKVNHVFSERYSPDQIALARMFDTNFWSA
ncbi:unnamed protein product [Trichogramma brassicae]|uniref:Uncharacterized protein n=1 Tax=Trichogramma brassicae TaxID=86971 RepID=A0A6H5HVD6_9HYME|nr:unnamed protein product [Trichogramma brassicae]